MTRLEFSKATKRQTLRRLTKAQLVRNAPIEVEDSNVTCRSCRDALTEYDDRIGDGYCYQCRSYWADVADGMFDD